jgi:hypothetical protein
MRGFNWGGCGYTPIPKGEVFKTIVGVVMGILVIAICIVMFR